MAIQRPPRPDVRPTPVAAEEEHREAAAASALVYETVTLGELAVRYQLENAALDARLDAERAKLDRERGPSRFRPAGGRS
jgi:hypothetical protein